MTFPASLFGLTENGVLEWSATSEWILVAVVLAVFTLGVSWWGSRGVRHRVASVGLLVPALLAMLWAVAGPVWVEGSGREVPGRTVVLVDNSASMSLVEDGQQRGEVALELLDSLGLEQAERFLFDSELKAWTTPDWTGGESDLGVALRAVRERYAGEKLRSVVVITDGIDRGSLREQWMTEGTLTSPTVGGPLTLYSIGEKALIEDTAIREVRTGGFAFIRAPFTMTVTVVGDQAGAEVPVTLSREGRLVARKRAVLDEQGSAELEFEVTPTRAGRFTYEVSIPVGPNDAVPANNTESVVVRVVRDRMRVLQVCGAPSLDQKFLRLLLKQDPAIDLVSFFILRTERDIPSGYGTEELSLIAFPYERLFTEDLESFDLVILQNFDYAPYFRWSADALLGNIADYVKSGGSLVMIGGDRSFDLGEYAGTPVEEVLPVKLGVQGEAIDLEPISPVVTEAGSRHPITRLLPDATENLALWERIAPLDGINRSRGAASGAAVLLEHPSLKDGQGRALPVVAVRAIGAGRSMAIMGDGSWRWSFTEAARGMGNQAYLRFWKNALRWLVGEESRVTLEGAMDNVRLGTAARLIGRVRDVGFDAQADVPVSLVVTDGADKLNLEGTTGVDGEVRFEFTPPRAGAWRATMQVEGQRGAKAETVFAVTNRDPELEEVRADPGFLQALAQATDGLFVAMGDQTAPLEDATATRKIADRNETPLWNHPFIPLVMALFASGSWWVRRRGGGR